MIIRYQSCCYLCLSVIGKFFKPKDWDNHSDLSLNLVVGFMNLLISHELEPESGILELQVFDLKLVFSSCGHLAIVLFHYLKHFAEINTLGLFVLLSPFVLTLLQECLELWCIVKGELLI